MKFQNLTSLRIQVGSQGHWVVLKWSKRQKFFELETYQSKSKSAVSVKLKNSELHELADLIKGIVPNK